VDKGGFDAFYRQLFNRQSINAAKFIAQIAHVNKSNVVTFSIMVTLIVEVLTFISLL